MKCMERVLNTEVLVASIEYVGGWAFCTVQFKEKLETKSIRSIVVERMFLSSLGVKFENGFTLNDIVEIWEKHHELSRSDGNKGVNAHILKKN